MLRLLQLEVSVVMSLTIVMWGILEQESTIIPVSHGAGRQKSWCAKQLGGQLMWHGLRQSFEALHSFLSFSSLESDYRCSTFEDRVGMKVSLWIPQKSGFMAIYSHQVPPLLLGTWGLTVPSSVQTRFRECTKDKKPRIGEKPDFLNSISGPASREIVSG